MVVHALADAANVLGASWSCPLPNQVASCCAALTKPMLAWGATVNAVLVTVASSVSRS